MAGNRLTLVQTQTNNFTIDLVDATGAPLAYAKLSTGVATFTLRLTPTGSNVLFYTTPDPVHLVIDPRLSTLSVALGPSDLGTFALGTYFYQIQITFPTGEIDIPIQWTPADLSLGGSASPTPPPFTNTVKINQDFPFPGSLQYVTPGGSPICDAQIRVYLQSDYLAGNLNSPVGTTTTDRGGGWLTPVLVLPGYTYVISFYKPFEFGPDIETVVGV